MKLTAFFRPPASLNGSWRLPRAVPFDMEVDAYVRLVQTAERGKFDTFFLQDSVAMERSDALAESGQADMGTNTRVTRLEPLQLMPALAVMTKNIGLVATTTTTYNEPYNVARRFLTLDHISGGRAGWNLVTSQAEDEAANFGFEKHMDHSRRYERASEFHDVVVGLWESWEGEFFKVRGPLNVARSPQGRPIVAQAGSSEPGKELAARTAEVVFTAQNSLSEAQAFYRDVKGRMAKYGRAPEEMKIMPGIMMICGETTSEVEERVEELKSMISFDIAFKDMARLSGGLDLTQLDLDGPLPELPPSNAALARQRILGEAGKPVHTAARLALRAGQRP
jgi:alkanesulfonate monooxygenase SsuD/methylene tetrahydromethanopterin reductase-like flavin-dependent oxidoreductase (luciferase family)